MSVQALLSLGADEHPEVFKQAETACRHYAQSVAPMTEKEQFDFRRGFELGCYFTIYNATAQRGFVEADGCREGSK